VPALPPYIHRSPSGNGFRPCCPSAAPTIRSDARPRIAERLVFEKLVQVLVFGSAYERIADKSCSESTLRREGARSGSNLE